jgi:catechol 2,3-dioxygenase-like lactoylglutathione lyase family enzyme
MQRIHINLSVRDLDESVRFYSTLLGADPTMQKADYAQWMLEDPRVNLSIVPAADGAAGLGHLGLQVEHPAELAELHRRVLDTEGPVIEEGDTECCYARSTKTWVEDPQGVRWETFHTRERIDERGQPVAAGGACCVPTDGGGCC